MSDANFMNDMNEALDLFEGDTDSAYAPIEAQDADENIKAAGVALVRLVFAASRFAARAFRAALDNPQ